MNSLRKRWPIALILLATIPAQAGIVMTIPASSATLTPPLVSSGAGTPSLRLGASSTANGNNSVAVGTTATANGLASTCVGDACSVVGTSQTCIGASCGSAVSGARGSCLGESCTFSGTGAALLGGSATDGGFNSCFAVARGATCTANSQGVFGSSTDSFLHWFIGQGVTVAGARTGIDVQPTGGTGTNIGSTPLLLRAGSGTGDLSTGQSASAPSLQLQVPRPGASGTGTATYSDLLATKDVAKTLTEGGATGVVNLTIPSGSSAGATIYWTVIANDASDFQSLTGQSQISAVNKAGTTTCQINTTVGATPAVSAGTLNPVTVAVGTGANLCQLTINATSSLTQTTLAAYWTCLTTGPGLCTAN